MREDAQLLSRILELSARRATLFALECPRSPSRPPGQPGRNRGRRNPGGGAQGIRGRRRRLVFLNDLLYFFLVGKCTPVSVQSFPALALSAISSCPKSTSSSTVLPTCKSPLILRTGSEVPRWQMFKRPTAPRPRI